MNPYDAVRYPSFPKEQSHPDRLATVAALHGMSPAPPEQCRVLELGCGTGANLISMAYTLPESRFTGIDAAAEPVHFGQSRIARLGLGNVTLLEKDILDIGPEFGEFDYIVAHGVYSWVPEPVRDKVMSICAANLAPQGVAYISYNAYPGCHLRAAVRDILLYHTAGISDAEQRIQQAYALASALAGSQAEDGLRREFEIVLERAPAVVYHDDLAPINHPVYFREFVAHASAHGLQFLSEAQLVAADGRLPEALASVLKPLEADPLRREQYLDFAKLRRFRQTLLCQGRTAIDRSAGPRSLRALYVSSKAEAGREEAGGAVEFKGEKGAAAKTVHPLAKAALRVMGRAWPRRFSFDQLLSEARRESGSTALLEQDSGALAEILWYTSQCGLVELHSTAGRFATQAGERPVASALARLELHDGDTASTLAHGVVEMEDAIGKRLVMLLDGTRDRAALAAELKVPLTAIENSLARLARLPLLLA